MSSTLSEEVRSALLADFSEFTFGGVDGHYLLIDIGANLTSRKFSKDLDVVLQRARDVGVCKIIVTGTSAIGSKEALRLTRLYPDILYSTAGVHPHDAKSWNDETEAAIREIASNSECVAIGECGLDYNRDFSPRDIQQTVFEKHIQIACDMKKAGSPKPLFLHERDAHEDFVRILEKYHSELPNVVVHCFTGNKQHALKYLEMGFSLGLTGFVAKIKNDDNGLIELIQQKLLPLDRLMLETDAPYCFPNIRSSKLPANIKDSLTDNSLSFLNRYSSFQRNEPSSLPVTLEIIAGYLEMRPEDLATKTTLNALRFFGISA